MSTFLLISGGILFTVGFIWIALVIADFSPLEWLRNVKYAKIFLPCFLAGIILFTVGAQLEEYNMPYHSPTYKNNSKYKKNVDSIADEYGISSSDVDAKIRAVWGD